MIGTLKRLGHEARRVPSGTTNGAVMQLARREHRVLITRDSDFANILLYPPANSDGVIYLAIHPPWLSKLVPPLTRLLHAIPADQFAGKTIILEETKYSQVP